MTRRGIIAVICFLFALSSAGSLYARESRSGRTKNLYGLVKDNKTLKVYLGSVESDAGEISSDVFRKVLKDFLSKRGKENFLITDTKEAAEVVIDAKIIDYKYLEEDPVDQISGGLTGLFVDAAVKQNYARIDVDFTVIRTRDSRKLWQRNFYSTVTESDMPPEASIPKVLEQCCKQFVFLCFSSSKR